MLKMEIIKFDPQDVVTASTLQAPVITCDCVSDCKYISGGGSGYWRHACNPVCLSTSTHPKAGK